MIGTIALRPLTPLVMMMMLFACFSEVGVWRQLWSGLSQTQYQPSACKGDAGHDDDHDEDHTGYDDDQHDDDD